MAGDTDLALANVRTGITIFGVDGSLAGPPANCSSDGQANCLVDGGSFAAGAINGAASKILSGQTVAGVSGNVTLPAMNKVLTGNSFGVAGTALSGSLTLPLAQNVLAGSGAYGDSVATVTPTLTLPAAGKVLSGTSYGASGNGSIGGLTLPAAANVLTGTGTYGDALALRTPTLILPAVGKVLLGMAYGVAGNGSTGTLTLPLAGAVRSSAGAYGDPGSTFTGTISDCAANGSACYVPAYILTTQPLKAINYDAINAGKASMRTSLTLSDIAGTLADCSANAATGCVTTPSYQPADLTNLAAGNIKRGISLGGVTGNFPSAASPIPRYTDSGATTAMGGTDISDLTTFITQLTSDGNFEYWDSTGLRRTGSGDSDITAAHVKNAVALENFSITGSSAGGADCMGDGQAGFTTTATYKSVDTSALTTWDIRKGKSAGGIGGSIAFYKNMANTTIFNRTTGTGAAAGLDIYDTIDDDSNYGAFPTQNNTGWDQATGANWTQVVASTVYKDNITGLVWLLDQGAYFTWWNAISQCENSTAGSRSDWRLPTQKELMQAYTDGIWSLKANLSLVADWYWSATSWSVVVMEKWVVYPHKGATHTNDMVDGLSRVVCVAP